MKFIKDKSGKASARLQARRLQTGTRTAIKLLALGAAFFLLSACAGAPCSGAYNLAKTALRHAKASDAETEASSDYKKAVKFYREGKSLFEQRLFDMARRKFNRSRIHSERAENIARLKKYKRGDFSN